MPNIDFTDRKTFQRYAGGRPRRRGRRLILIVSLLLCTGASVAAFFPAGSAAGGVTHTGRAVMQTREEALSAYRRFLQTLERDRTALAARLAAAVGAKERQAVLRNAAAVFSAAVERDIIPAWYGTGYDYNGAADAPGEGSISCGHFVTTVLRDAGVNLDRIGLAQLPSEALIRALAGEKKIRRYSGTAGEDFIDSCRKLPAGLYLLGLDKHVGFLITDSAGVWFVHSTLLPPYGVVREPAASSRTLMGSGYRVLGSLSANEDFIKKWLAGGRIGVPR